MTDDLLPHEKIGMPDPLVSVLGIKRTRRLGGILEKEGRGYDPRSDIWKRIEDARLQYALAFGYSTFARGQNGCPEPIRQAIKKMVALDMEHDLLEWKKAKQLGFLDEKDSLRQSRITETWRKLARDIGYEHHLPDDDVALRMRKMREAETVKRGREEDRK